ncbi:hypothetical protein QG37_01437 [Candidozyma auris]|nr:hypothetical protein QG37_01437 [[Candida] auris]
MLIGECSNVAAFLDLFFLWEHQVPSDRAIYSLKKKTLISYITLVIMQGFPHT